MSSYPCTDDLGGPPTARRCRPLAALRLQRGDALLGCALRDAEGRGLGVLLAIGRGAPCGGAAAPRQLLGTLCGLAALPLGHALAQLHPGAHTRVVLGSLPAATAATETPMMRATSSERTIER